jgi:diadenylate cyclase
MELLRLPRWQDVLDIILVAVIIYHLLLLIKGTKAIQMLLGLCVLLFASVLSGYFEFYTINWIIQSFWSQIMIALIVLFQPEIRRALAKMGEARFLQSLTSAEGLRSLDEIIRASVHLANRKTGALIVIERDTSLEDFVEMGTSLDARVSKEILQSIFNTSSPIHDGAVIIKGNRIVAAGCFLPISPNAELDKKYGTRHRAAIGLTEETDAIALVVSEETGAISMTIGSKIETGLDLTSLRRKLTDLFATDQRKGAFSAHFKSHRGHSL